MHDNILGLVSDDDEEASALLGDSVANQRGNARITISKSASANDSVGMPGKMGVGSRTVPCASLR